MPTKTITAARGQKIRTDYARDDSSHSVPNDMGKKLGGSTTNIGHSITGASAQIPGHGSPDKKNRFK
jgi:hypothetical protein